MPRKLNNKEWKEFIDSYYANAGSDTINEFCKKHDVSKQQFHYHKKRLRYTETKEQPVFHQIKLNNEIASNKKSEQKSKDIKISIGNISIDIPASETILISSIIKELVSNVES